MLTVKNKYYLDANAGSATHESRASRGFSEEDANTMSRNMKSEHGGP